MGGRFGDLIGHEVGGYVLRARLGEGGMGAVYLGVDPLVGRRVAVKVLLDATASAEARERFLREARAIAQIEDPHIVAIHDFARLPDGRSYISMEHLVGESLQSMRKRRGIFPPAEAVAICAQALSGLAAAHARGIVHRDVKPANLFLARGDDGEVVVKVLDFGVAKLRTFSDGATRKGAILGTPEYMSPEQASGNAADVDARADVYSMGIVLYALLAGQTPFKSPNWGRVLTAHQFDPPPPLQHVAGVTPALERAVMRALAKAPADRFEDALAMQRALLDAVGGATAPIAPPEVAEILDGPPSDRSSEAPTLDAPPTPALPLHSAPPPTTGTMQLAPRPPREEPRARVPTIAVAGAALALVALASASLALHAPRAQSAAAPGEMAATVERCAFVVDDVSGQAHAFGGARRRLGGAGGDTDVVVSPSGDRTALRCMVPAGNGYATLALEVPSGAQRAGAHALAGDTSSASLDFSLAPPGFGAARFRAGGGARDVVGTLVVTEWGAGDGAVVAGAFDGVLPAAPGGSGPPATVHATFRVVR